MHTRIMGMLGMARASVETNLRRSGFQSEGEKTRKVAKGTNKNNKLCKEMSKNKKQKLQEP